MHAPPPAPSPRPVTRQAAQRGFDQLFPLPEKPNLNLISILIRNTLTVRWNRLKRGFVYLILFLCNARSRWNCIVLICSVQGVISPVAACARRGEVSSPGRARANTRQTFTSYLSQRLTSCPRKFRHVLKKKREIAFSSNERLFVIYKQSNVYYYDRNYLRNIFHGIAWV